MTLESGLDVTTIPSIYNDVPVDIATNSEENEVLAGSLPLFPILHFIGFTEAKPRPMQTMYGVGRLKAPLYTLQKARGDDLLSRLLPDSISRRQNLHTTLHISSSTAQKLETL